MTVAPLEGGKGGKVLPLRSATTVGFKLPVTSPSLPAASGCHPWSGLSLGLHKHLPPCTPERAPQPQALLSLASAAWMCPCTRPEQGAREPCALLQTSGLGNARGTSLSHAAQTVSSRCRRCSQLLREVGPPRLRDVAQPTPHRERDRTGHLTSQTVLDAPTETREAKPADGDSVKTSGFLR